MKKNNNINRGTFRNLQGDPRVSCGGLQGVHGDHFWSFGVRASGEGHLGSSGGHLGVIWGHPEVI
jgi:hypothetical protein